jgi:hydrogenase maturation protease
MKERENDSFPRSGRDILIIGYGNEMRGDDGAGRRLADEVESWRLDGVKTLSLRQLNPEVAAALSGKQHVVFVDATPEASRRMETRLPAPETAEGRNATTHHCNPSRILTLARQINGSAPPATLITIPGERFGWEERLSPVASANLDAALDAVRRLIRREKQTEGH